MSKKSRRQVSAAPAAPVRIETTPKINVNTPTPMRSSGLNEFNPDYSHVLRDLKQIGIMAGSFVVILIILSFIIK
jgi:hypothetical protein